MSVSQAGWTRASLRRILASNNFEYTITGLILFNALLLGLDTVPAVSRQFARELDFLNDLILGIFVVELTLRMFAFGRDFWRHGWSWFDMFVVGIGLLPFAEGFTALRTLRVIRLLRIVSVVPSLRRVVEGLVRALPGLGAIVILILVLLYVFSVMATKLFATTNPDLFGDLGASAFSLFTVMTLEGWPDLARSVMEQHPWAWAFFIVFILMSSWAVLNLFIGVIVEAMQSGSELSDGLSRAEPVGSAEINTVLAELRSLRLEVHRMSELVENRRK
jgi:voltage-gated sodium channel